MSELQLKRISPDGIPHALEKAERYRLLNDPAQAESIYRDVLAVDADHQTALRALIRDRATLWMHVVAGTALLATLVLMIYKPGA